MVLNLPIRLKRTAKTFAHTGPVPSIAFIRSYVSLPPFGFHESSGAAGDIYSWVNPHTPQG